MLSRASWIVYIALVALLALKVAASPIAAFDVTSDDFVGDSFFEAADVNDSGFDLDDPFLDSSIQSNAFNEAPAAPAERYESPAVSHWGFTKNVGAALNGNSRQATGPSSTSNRASVAAAGPDEKDFVPIPTEAPSVTGTFNATTNEVTKLTAYTGIAAAIFIITGFILVFWGHQVFKPVLFISGFYFL
ncbi:hypothetical protein HDU96_005542, partial [Phlyctochytrium bullatum]